MPAVEDETGDAANGKERKEMTWSKRDERNLGVELVSPLSSSFIARIPADS